MTVKPHTACRACGSTALTPYLDLGSQAPANALVPDGGAIGPEFTAPLSVSWCSACGLSQLDHVVDPNLLYAKYPFRAGVSQRWRDHCVELITATSSRLNGKRPFVIDIGSNDGALLEEAKRKGWKVLGVDPSDTGNANVPTLLGFWDSGIAGRIARLHGQADVITATNVFGHVDNAKDFLEGVMLALKPTGFAVIECPHILPLLDAVAFDTIYHEHLTYWSLRPLEVLAEQVGLRVVDIKMFPELHGGTMRYVLTPGDNKTKVGTKVAGIRILESAMFQDGLKPYAEFATKVLDNLHAFRELLRGYSAAGNRIWGYGANAKAAVRLQASGLSEVTIEQIVDDTEQKWGLRTPGTHIPIRPISDMAHVDICVLLSWNNAPALKAKAKAHGFAGRFLIPVPRPHFEAA